MNIGIKTVLIAALAVCILSLFAAAAAIFFARRTVVRFTDEIAAAIDCCMRGEMPNQLFTEDTLADKVRSRLTVLYEAMKLREEVVNREREELQSLISDVTHQVRTPMTNLRMLNETLLASALEQQSESAQTAASDKAEKREYESQVQFLQSAQKQIQRLDFLMEALIKTSRLETGLITLSKKETPVCDTLADALGGVLLAAEKKNLNITADCSEDLTAFYDRKWTTEAVFNLLDNAVKYTQEGGHIRVSAQRVCESPFRKRQGRRFLYLPSDYSAVVTFQFARRHSACSSAAIFFLFRCRDISVIIIFYTEIHRKAQKAARIASR